MTRLKTGESPCWEILLKASFLLWGNGGLEGMSPGLTECPLEPDGN